MRAIVVFLSGDRGEATVKTVAGAGHHIQALVVPSAKRERFASLAQFIGAELLAPAGVNDPDFISALGATQPCLGICAGFSTIFSGRLIDAFEAGIINLHAGRVPEYRGGSPLNWQIINGEKQAGLSVLAMTPGIDDGNVLASTEIEIGEDDDIASLHTKANAAFPALVLDAMEAVDAYMARRLAGANAPAPGLPQCHARAIYRLQRNDADGAIDWHRMTAQQVHNLVRAITRPYPGAHSNGIRVWRTTVWQSRIAGPPGRVAYLRGEGPFVCCSDRAIKIEEWSGDRPKHGDYL